VTNQVLPTTSSTKSLPSLTHSEPYTQLYI
jgi:hypothetical protein